MDSYTYIANKQEFFKMLPELQQADMIGLDVVATSLDTFTAKWLLLQLNIDNHLYVLDVRKLGLEQITYLIQLIKDKNILCINHNIKYDIGIIYHYTKELITNVYDTMLAEILIHQGLGKKFPSLSELVMNYFLVSMDKDIRKTFINYDKDYFTEEQLLYSALDVKYLFDIRKLQISRLEVQKQLKILDLENSLVPVFCIMEYEGIPIDEKKWLENVEKQVKIAENLRKTILDFIMNNLKFDKDTNAFDMSMKVAIPVKTKKLTEELKSLSNSFATDWIKANINLDSPLQVKKIFWGLGIEVENTNEKVLKDYKTKHPLVGLLLDYRDAGKKLSTYGESFLKNINPVTGRIHSEFNQLGTSTGRISSDSPNCQNIPRDSDYRSCFIAPQDCSIMAADYSQAELRLVAQVSGEPEMIKAFLNNEDLHARSATTLFEKLLEDITPDERWYGKTLNFGIVYGISEYGLLYNFGIPLNKGEEYLKKYFNFYSVLDNFIEQAGKMVWKNKYSTTLLGRKRFFEDKKIFKDIFEEQRFLARVKREGVNAIIQGGVADIIKIAMINIARTNPFGDKFKMVLQVHDELVFIVHNSILKEAEEFIKKLMIEAEELFITDIPCLVDVKKGPCWLKG